jgi:predicted ATP-grasp superfamily ATP-dependent carboligase
MSTSRITVALDRVPTLEVATSIGNWLMIWLTEEEAVRPTYTIFTQDRHLFIETQYPITQRTVDAFLRQVDYYADHVLNTELCIQDVVLCA